MRSSATAGCRVFCGSLTAENCRAERLEWRSVAALQHRARQLASCGILPSCSCGRPRLLGFQEDAGPVPCSRRRLRLGGHGLRRLQPPVRQLRHVFRTKVVVPGNMSSRTRLPVPTMHSWTAKHYVVSAIIILLAVGMFATAGRDRTLGCDPERREERRRRRARAQRLELRAHLCQGTKESEPYTKSMSPSRASDILRRIADALDRLAPLPRPSGLAGGELRGNLRESALA